MAQVVAARLKGIEDFNPGNQTLSARVQIYDGTNDTEELLGPISVATVAAFEDGLKDAIQTWAETNWSTEFGLGDTVFLYPARGAL